MSSRLLVVFLAAVLPSGCTLPELRELGCGDSVLSEGEDCDGRYVMEGSTCGEVGTPNECLYVCSDGASCPEGWGCGIDDRCYQPQPELDAVTARELLPAGAKAVSDVDGDGVGDLAASDGLRLSVSFGAGADALSSGFTLSLPSSASPWFGSFDGDAPTDVVVPQVRALLAFAGAPTREYVPRLFSSARESVRIAAGATVEADGDLPSELLILTEIETENGIESSMRFRGCEAVPLPGGRRLSLLASPLSTGLFSSTKRIPRADLDGDGITEFALPFRGRSELLLYTSDAAPGGDPATCPRPIEYAKAPVITLPDGFGIADSNVLFADVNGDTHLDIVLSLGGFIPDDVPPDSNVVNPATTVWVAEGTDDGSFPAPLQQLAGIELVQEGFYEGVLAAGDLDGDERGDYVLPSGIFLTRSPDGTSFERVVSPRTHIWSEALVVDVNADGFQDVIGASNTAPGIDWLVNAGIVGLPGQFNRYIVDTKNVVSHLRTGDFNGDFNLDAAVVETGLVGGPDELNVVFGIGSGLPGEAQPNGLLGGTTWLIEVGVQPDLGSTGGDEIDGISDLVILSSPERTGPGPIETQEARFYDLLGSTAQKLLSLLYVFDPADEEDGPRVLQTMAVGNFTGGAGASAGPGVVVVSVPESLGNSPPGSEIDASIALFTSTPDGDLQRAAVSQEVIDQMSSYLPDCVHWLAGDVDGAAAAPGVDELVAVEGSRDCNRSGDGTALGVLVLDLSDPPADPAAGRIRRIELPSEYQLVYTARLADLDLDSRLDLVLVGVFAQDPENPGAAGPISEVVILWNDDACATPPFCSQSSTRLPAHDLREVTDGSVGWPSPYDAVPMQLDGDRHLELAVLYARFYSPGQGRTAVSAYGSDPEAPREYQRLVIDVNRDGKEDRNVLLDLGSSNVIGMVAGDLNGDGLDDLVLDETSVSRAWVQRPAKPLGTTMASPGAVGEARP